MSSSHLQWPFFEAAHRRRQAELTAWCAQHLSGHVSDHDRDALDARCIDLVSRLGQSGWLGHAVASKAHGGHSDTIDTRQICLLRETLAYHDALADFAFAMQGLGSGAISLFGTPEQRAQHLPAVVQGNSLAGFALSEPQSGSDVAAMQCEARAKGEGYVLNGIKTWISNGGIASFYVVFARTGEAPGAKGISAFIVEAKNPGLSITERIDVIAPHPLATLRFDNCWVAQSQRIGSAGTGFKIAMATLDVFRTSVAASALGMARRALDEAVEWARNRPMFGQKLADLQITQSKVAQMASLLDAAALLTYRAAWTRDQGLRITREAAMAKMSATENAQLIIDMAVQLHGAAGLRKGHVLEALYREIRALRIYEGATEVQQLIIGKDLLNT